MPWAADCWRRIDLTQEQAVIGKIIARQGKVIMDAPALGRARGFVVEVEGAPQLAALGGDIAKLEQGRAKIALVARSTVLEGRGLQVFLRSGEVAAFHGKRGTQQAMAPADQR